MRATGLGEINFSVVFNTKVNDPQHTYGTVCGP